MSPPAPQTAPVRADLVLVGGGHAHVQVLRRWAMRPLPGVRLHVVLDRPEAVYSGMVPGFVAGDYAARELAIDVVPLARRARARVVLAEATRVDPAARRIELDGRPSIAYDVASLDVGSSVRGLDLPGVREHALPTRPIRGFVDAVDGRLRRAARDGRPLRVAVVGSGVAGLELAFTLEARLRALGRRAEIALLGDAAPIAPGLPPSAVRRARREAERRGIRIHTGLRARGVAKDAVLVERDAVLVEGDAVPVERDAIPCDVAVWATGAAPPPLLDASALPRDARGFVRVRDTLEVVDCDGLFAAGDCASLDERPWVPKAGVYAVREGPILDANLRARLGGRPLRRYRPQRNFLALLNLGERRALGSRWRVAFAGDWVWRLKDAIDRRFVRRFQLLSESGEPTGALPLPAAMGMEPMECGGCAAKVSAPALERALARLGAPPDDASVLRGLSPPDDAAVIATPAGDVLLATVDAFRAFLDDPWLVGRVAALNAASDVWAKGGTPRHALAVVSVPETDPRRAEETLYQVLAGVRASLDPLGISLVGGHSTTGTELFVGLSVTGSLPSAEAALPLEGLRPGDALLLTKPLGTGVVLAADMQGLAPARWRGDAIRWMLRPNADAARVARAFGARASTDVSGFGLARHLASMLAAGGVGAELDLAAVPALDGALALLARGLRSTYHAQNRLSPAELARGAEPEGSPALELLFDPQTSGGLLLGVPAERAGEALAELRAEGDVRAARIGSVTEARAEAPPLRVRAASPPAG